MGKLLPPFPLRLDLPSAGRVTAFELPDPAHALNPRIVFLRRCAVFFARPARGPLSGPTLPAKIDPKLTSVEANAMASSGVEDSGVSLFRWLFGRKKRAGGHAEKPAVSRRYRALKAGDGYPAASHIFYECGICGNAIPSHLTGACSCRNIMVDADAGRVSIEDNVKFRVYEEW